MKHRSTQFYFLLAIVFAIVTYTLTHKEASDVPKWMLTDWVAVDTDYVYDGNTEMKDTAQFVSHFRISFCDRLGNVFRAKELVTVYLDPIYDNGDITKGELK